MRRATGVSFAIALALVSGASFSPFTPVTAQEAEDVPPPPIAWLAPYATETATEDVREVQKWIDAAPEKPAGKDTGRFQTTDLTIGEATLFVLRSADPDRGLEEQKSTIEATRVELARSEDGVASADIVWLEMHLVVDGTTSEARTAGTAVARTPPRSLAPRGQPTRSYSRGVIAMDAFACGSGTTRKSTRRSERRA